MSRSASLRRMSCDKYDYLHSTRKIDNNDARLKAKSQLDVWKPWGNKYAHYQPSPMSHLSIMFLYHLALQRSKRIIKQVDECRCQNDTRPKVFADEEDDRWNVYLS